ncbi:MAG: cation transporter [Bacteroidales bacterium]|nr:cation transporter [Bacteroidales bacterium]MCB8999777.1 cation transporter [Bacteroidales bacterium]
MDDRQKTLIRASWISILGNAFLALMKITLGIIAGSLAVIADGIDSSSDIATSLITLFTARLLTRPPNIRFPYGYEKADAMATKALSFVILFAGAQLAISTIGRLLHPVASQPPSMLAIYVTIVSIIGKLGLSYYLRYTGKSVSSAMLMANAKNMQNDVLISLAVLIGLAFTFIFKMPILDTITALIVSIWVIKVGLQIFFQTNTELMDGLQDPILYCELFKAVKLVEGAKNPHRVRLRKIGNLTMISMDVEVDPDITITEAHEIARKVENSIKENLPNVYDIVVHIEPLGNEEANEKFGIKEGDVSSFSG